MTKCHKCKLEFTETSLQHNKRLITEGRPICRDCNRISLAFDRAELRLKTRDPILSELKKYKKDNIISPSYIMRKYKVSYIKALEIAHKV